MEESIVDREAKTFTTYTRNINFTKLMTVVEKCTYYVSPENEGWSVIELPEAIEAMNG